MFSMGWFISFVVFALVWWTVLFCVLPVGVKPDPQGDVELGGWRGAPTRPMIWRKLLWTTLISVVIWAAIIALVDSNLISFRDEWLAIPDR
jgi:predicted secreted protein